MLSPVDLGILSPIMIVFCGVLMVVLRAGASRVFFDIVGTFRADELMDDVEASVTTMNAIVIDGLSGMEEAGAMVAEQMQKIVEATVPLSYELEKATIEFQKFVSEAEGARLADEVRQVGLQFGFTSNEALEAGARMAQLSSLLGENAVPAATEMALAFGLIGDMTPETAMQKLINLQQQTGFLYGDNTKAAYNLLTAEQQVEQVRREMAHTLNTLNKVEDNSAATMSKITGVMNEFASQAHLAGEEISMMAAMSATLIEAGEEQGKGGRALRMIYARLGADTSGSATALAQLGVETKNADGSLRALSDILADLDPKWRQMNSGQKQAVAQVIAGNRHYVRFIKLAENYDRIIELNTATTGEMGEVYSEAGEPVNYLNKLMNSNAVAMDRANAELELVTAQIGDFFIPTTVAATEFQVLFNQELLNMLQGMGGLGNALQGFFEFQQIISGVFAPFFSAVINVKAMNVAMLTQRQIMRALNGEQLQRNMKTKAAHEEEIANMKLLSAGLEELKTQNIGLTIANQNRWSQQRQADAARRPMLKQETLQIKEMITQVQNKTRVTRTLASVERERRAYNRAVDELALFTQKRSIDLTKWETDRLKYKTQTQNAVQDRIIAVRFAQEKLNLALQEEIRILDLEHTRMKRRNNILWSSVVLLDDYKFSLRGATFATKSLTVATEEQTAAIMRMSMTLMKFGMIIFVAEMLVLGFKDAIPGITDEAHAARIAVILMGMGMALMAAEMIWSTSAIIGNTFAVKGASLAQKAHTTWVAITTSAMSFQTAVVNAFTVAWTLMKSVMSVGAFIVIAIGIALAIDKYIVPRFKKMTEHSTEATDALLENEQAAYDYAAGVNDAFGNIDFSVFGEGAEAMDEFNNSREEMFFGFKAGQTTGELVKQVKQGGVDNFVQNTEVIMTNNFNGLTVDEMVDEIISQIEVKSFTHGNSTMSVLVAR